MRVMGSRSPQVATRGLEVKMILSPVALNVSAPLRQTSERDRPPIPLTLTNLGMRPFRHPLAAESAADLRDFPPNILRTRYNTARAGGARLTENTRPTSARGLVYRWSFGRVNNAERQP